MLVSTKGRYALRAMVDLAEHQNEGHIPLKSIAERQGVSDKYLESILKSLVGSKAIVGMRGKGGGYMLTKEPRDYTVGEILRLVEDDLAPIEGLDGDHSELPQISQYRILDMWRELDRRINEYLDSVTIADLADTSGGIDYYVI